MSESNQPSHYDLSGVMRTIRKLPFYWGPLSRHDAETILHSKPTGSFLFRDTAHMFMLVCASVCTRDGVRHVLFDIHDGRLGFWYEAADQSRFCHWEKLRDDSNGTNQSSSRLNAFIHDYLPGGEILSLNFRHPVSRIGHVGSPERVQSLRHLCRFQILNYLRFDQVPLLGIPFQLKRYLLTPQYFVEPAVLESYLGVGCFNQRQSTLESSEPASDESDEPSIQQQQNLSSESCVTYYDYIDDVAESTGERIDEERREFQRQKTLTEKAGPQRPMTTSSQSSTSTSSSSSSSSQQLRCSHRNSSLLSEQAEVFV